MNMRSTVIVATVLALSSCASVPGDATTQRYVLKDGNVLLIDPDGGMRMFDSHRDPVMMKDGVPMELADGTSILMKENVIWKSTRTRGALGPKS